MLTLAILLSSVVLGGHVLMPLLLAFKANSAGEEQPPEARTWALLSAPLLLSTGIGWLLVQSSSSNLGLSSLEGQSRGLALASLPLELKLAALLFLSLLLTDLLVLFSWSKLEKNAWFVVTALGVTALLGTTYAFNSVAFRLDPSSVAVVAETQGDFYVETSNLQTVSGGTTATVIRAILLSLISLCGATILQGLILRDHPAETRLRFLPWIALLATAAYVLTLPLIVRSALLQQQDHLTGLSAALLLGIQPWLPRSLRWPSLVLAMGLLALLLTRVSLAAG